MSQGKVYPDRKSLPRGRILIVLPPPRLTDKRPNYVTFAGPIRKSLYLATAHTIYKRPSKNLRGIDPSAPAKPR